MIVRREVQERVGDWDGDLGYLEDWDMWVRISAVADAAAVDRVAVAYLQHEETRSLAPSAELLAAFEEFSKKHIAARERLAVAPDETMFMRFAAERQRRAGRSREARAPLR